MENIQQNQAKTRLSMQDLSKETDSIGRFGARKTEKGNDSTEPVFKGLKQEQPSVSGYEGRPEPMLPTYSNLFPSEHKKGVSDVKDFLRMYQGGETYNTTITAMSSEEITTMSGEEIISTLEQCRGELTGIIRDNASVLRYSPDDTGDSLILSIIGDEEKQTIRKKINDCINSIQFALMNNDFSEDILAALNQQKFFVVTSEIKQKINILTSLIERYGNPLQTKYASPLNELLKADDEPIEYLYEYCVNDRVKREITTILPTRIALDLLLGGDFDKDFGLFDAVILLRDGRNRFAKDIIKTRGCDLIKLKSNQDGNGDSVQLMWGIFSVLGYWARSSNFMEHYAVALKKQKGIDLYKDDTFINFVCNRVKDISEIVEFDPDYQPVYIRKPYGGFYLKQGRLDGKKAFGFLLESDANRLSALKTSVEKTRFALNKINTLKPKEHKSLYGFFCSHFEPNRSEQATFLVDLLERGIREHGKLS